MKRDVLRQLADLIARLSVIHANGEIHMLAVEAERLAVLGVLADVQMVGGNVVHMVAPRPRGCA